MKEKFKSPTVYGDFKNYVDVVPFDIFSIEAAGLNLLCNIDGNIRARVLELFPLLRIINYALSKQHDTTVADIIEEIAQQTIEKLYIRYVRTIAVVYCLLLLTKLLCRPRLPNMIQCANF